MRALALRLASIAFGCVVAIAIAEVALRGLGVEAGPGLTKRLLVQVPADEAAPFLVQYHCFATNPHGELAPAPAVVPGRWRLFTTMLRPRELPLSRLAETPWCVRYVLSNRPLRLRDWDPESPPWPLDTRLAVVGDSFVRGVGVPSAKSLPAQLELLLGDGVSVVNAGFPGADLHTEVRILRSVVEAVHPSAALVVFIPNDVSQNDELRRRQAYIDDLIVIRDEYLASRQADAWYQGKLRLVRLIGSVLDSRRIARETLSWYLDSYDAERNPEGMRLLQDDLAAIARTPDCPVGLVLYPLLVGLEGSYPLASVHATVVRMATAAGLPVLDLAPAFAGADTESLEVHPTDHHPDGKAHAIAARRIADWLRREAPEPLRTAATTPQGRGNGGSDGRPTARDDPPSSAGGLTRSAERRCGGRQAPR